MLYNAVLVSAVEQSKSAICIHRSILLQTQFPHRSLQSIPVIYTINLTPTRLLGRQSKNDCILQVRKLWNSASPRAGRGKLRFPPGLSKEHRLHLWQERTEPMSWLGWWSKTSRPCLLQAPWASVSSSVKWGGPGRSQGLLRTCFRAHWPLTDAGNQTKKGTGMLQITRVRCPCVSHWEGQPGPPASGLCELGRQGPLLVHSSPGAPELTSA